MTNKPEVIAYRCSDPEDPDIGHWLDDDAWNVPFALNEPLILLADHERLQAEAERLQAERAADKERIKLLENLLRCRCLPMLRAYSRFGSAWDDSIKRIEAALDEKEPAEQQAAPDVAALVEALRDLCSAYRLAIHSGYERIKELNGGCDRPAKMLDDCAPYRKALGLLAAHCKQRGDHS